MTHDRLSPPFHARKRIAPPLIILCLMAVLSLVALFVVSGPHDASAAPSAQAATMTPSPTPTPAYATSGPISEGLAIRTYGYENLGAGDSSVTVRTVIGPGTGAVGTGYVEDKPYTDPEAPFDPQNQQAPRYDSITWNPAIMSEQFTPDENARAGLYSRLFATGSGINIAEKVWHRQWYEPRHLDKDQDPSGVPGTIDPNDIFYPAIMQEFTYGLIGNQPLRMEPPPIYARAGGGTMVFPVGQRASELLDGNGNFTPPGPGANVGRGLTSLDGDFDGIPDIVHIESEQSLFNHLNSDVALDFNGNRFLDPLDTDGLALTGDELLVLRLDDKVLYLDNDPTTPNVIQFLDHMAVLRSTLTNPPGAVFDIYWTGSFSPRYLGTIQLGRGDAALANVNGAPQVIRAAGNGGTSGGNLCAYPGGPWFIYVTSSDAADNRATVVVGRALGATFAPMESNGATNGASTEPWWLKRMYVDGHEYNTVAISTNNSGIPIGGNANNGCAIAPGTAVNDPSEFTYITLRTPIPKGPDVFIAQHSVILEGYLPGERLSMLPPFNYEHYHLADVQSVTSFPTRESDVPYFGPLIGPVAPILQDDGPFPYQAFQGPQYNDPAAMSWFYVQEDREPQFLGELAERYAQTAEGAEFWYTQHFWTLPDQFTAFIMPNTPEGNPPTPPGANPDLYLLASGFRAPEGMYLDWEQFEAVPEDSVGGRAKFWFDPDGQGAGQNKIYKDATGIRIYGRADEGVQTRGPNFLPTLGFPIEVPYYTDWLSIFDPRGAEAPVKDSLTLNPAYLAEFRSGTEPLAPYYGLIAADGIDARQKVFPRIWYEPDYLDKTLRVPPTLRLNNGVPLQAPVIEVEPNNVCSDAAVTNLSQNNGTGRYTGSLPLGDADIYRFTISTARRVRIFTDPNGALPVQDPGLTLDQDTYIQLYKTCTAGVLSEPIDWDDNSGAGLTGSIDARLPDGAYYVRVINGPQSNGVGAYALNIWANPSAYEEYRFPALQQEYTYLFLDFNDNPVPTGPGGRFFFPTATDRQNLPVPLSNAGFGWSPGSPSHGAGLTTFDTNFDGVPEVVNIEHEQSLASLTGIQADFNANGVLDVFDPNVGIPSQLSGDELVIFRTEGLDLGRGTPVQFLDYMVRLTNVDYTTGRTDLEIWFTGGGLHPVNGGGTCPFNYSKHPDFIRTISLNRGEMAIVDRNSVRRIGAGGTNIVTPGISSTADGAWFVYVQGVSAPIPGQPASERASVVLGRALGAAAAAIDDGNGGHSFAAPQAGRGGPWYLKRFFVDGHEYNVVAVITEPGTTSAAAALFKGITIRTPAPKPCDFVNYEDSIVLQGYFQGDQFGVDTNLKSVMPPFNMPHTVMEDIVPRQPEQFAREPYYLCPVARPGTTASRILPNRPALRININREDREPRFFGELKEMQDYDTLLGDGGVTVTRPPVWSTEQFHTLPDQFTDISLPNGEYYLMTSSWETDLGRLSYRGCHAVIDTHNELAALHPPFGSIGAFSNAPVDPIPPTNVAQPPAGDAYQDYFQALADPAFTGSGRIRVQFWYNPTDGGPGPAQPGPDQGDIYVNLWQAQSTNPNATPTPTATRTATAQPTRTPTPTQTLVPGQPTATQTPTPTPTSITAPTGSTIRIVPQSSTIAVGQTTTLTVEIEGVNNLYGLDYQLLFNGQIVTIEDSDGNAGNGVNVMAGPFPAANNGGNRVIGENNVVGNLINYAVSLVAPSQPQSGNGVILSFLVRGVQPGTATFNFNSVQMLDGNADPVTPSPTVIGGVVVVTESSNAGSAAGKVFAQGRVEHAGVLVNMGNASHVSDSEGNYALTSQPGTYDILATLTKYLPSAYSGVPIALNGMYSVPTMALRGGDANSDGKVDLFDLVIVASNFDIHPIVNANADINEDGVVDIIDLVLVGGSYGHSGVQDGAALTAKVQAKAAKGAPSAARVSLDAPSSVKAGQEFKVAVKLSDVKGLFGANVSVTYDAARVQLVDADTNADGVQATAGSLMEGGYVAKNKGADGLYRFGATRVAPQAAFDGSGALVTLTFRAVESGNPNIAVSDARLVDEDADALPALISSGK